MATGTGSERLLESDSIINIEMEPEKDTSSRHGDDSSDDTFTDGDGGLSEEEAVTVKVPLRNARRKSVMPPPSLKLNGNDFIDCDGQDQSPQNSITSINSISSLLKEKLALSFPAMLKKKRPQEYKLRAFVGILFLCIVFLVGFAYVFYHQQVLQRAYFESIRFNNEERVVRVFSNEGQEIMFGYLGMELGGDRAFPCLPHNILDDKIVCMEWMDKARLYINYTEHVGVRCYHITWESLRENYHPTDCYDWSDGHGHWYGGGQTDGMAWPIEKGSIELSPFITGDIRQHVWGNVLKRYFINSNGVTIFIDPDTPLYVSMNTNHQRQFCLQARHDDFAYVYHSTPLPQLNYSICTSSNMKSLHSFFSEKQLWDGLNEEDLKVITSLLTEPVWQIPSASGSELTEVAIYNYTEDVIALGFLKQGHVLLSESWQPHVGDFTLDPVRFPTMDETIDIIHRRGFRIVFTIQPFLSTESTNFADAVWKHLLVSEREPSHHIPALTRYKGVESAGMLDITNNRTVPWLQAKLKSLVDKYHIDAFYLDIGTAYDMPHYYRFENPLTNPDEYKTIFIDSILRSVDVVGVSSAITRPQAPVFVSLPPFASTWKSMQLIIPTVLTYGIMGYPFIMPGAVGGDYDMPGEYNSDFTKNSSAVANKSHEDGGNNIHLPDKELYVRWLQLATFLPVIRYTHLPSKYGDERVLEMAKFLTSLRQKTVNPLLEKCVKDALDFGKPIIRPLWLLDPNDPTCHLVVDEFSVGEELIVAPVLYPRKHEREVYLPAGVWKDGIDGSLRKGSRWLHNYAVPEDKVAHFVKMPDDTRF
ncbi:myogenesis-regulating glycosidase isoform X2 [Periplaneta americana]|uniref:myogenesis-regulating glycosidase isoform X2 n=1 Tax=Periplaneta americana TaxID=6978 RepID=UPI0037E97F12